MVDDVTVRCGEEAHSMRTKCLAKEGKIVLTATLYPRLLWSLLRKVDQLSYFFLSLISLSNTAHSITHL